MTNALLEIGCEEIPARFMPDLLADLKKKTEEKLTRERLSFTKVATLGTYRRLTLYVESLAPKQTSLSEEVRGPAAEIAFDAGGHPTPAALGFAKSQQVDLKQLTVRTINGRNYVFAQVVRKGKTAEQILAKIFPEIISSLYLPLAMRWGALEVKFVRPIHWLVALCGSRIVKFEYAGIRSGDTTQGHRFLKFKKQNAKFKNAELLQYKRGLRKIGVIADQNERSALIRHKVAAAAKSAGGQALMSDELLSEVNFLVENPEVYVGKFNSEYLELPATVLITAMKKHQKYFPLLEPTGSKELLPKFAVVTDGCKNRGVVGGNQKVLSARLADARFFFEEDKKTPLRLRISELSRVAYFEKLGTLAQKSERLAKLSEWLGKRLGVGEETLKLTRRIAELCKADLTTKMVYEFPELQGEMGRQYAALSGEDPRVALGIYEHYLPRFAEDVLPQTLPGTLVALADRIDTLVGCFSIGAVPSGSVDPYGLRRAALGLIKLVTEKRLDLPLDETVQESGKLYEPVLTAPAPAKLASQLLEFIAGRLKPLLLEAGLRYDVVDAVLGNFNDILDTVLKARVIDQLAKESWFTGVVKSADRVYRIAKEAKPETVREHDLVDKEEKALYELYLKVNWEVGEAVKKEDWLRAVQELARLTDPLEQFFDKVLVMHQDERLKTNRLALLKSIGTLYNSIADFKKIVVPGG